ncbi:MAG: protochlorophyllide oxidoreductase [Sandaracinaceae bacterium]|nr:protochlorophyllide oxidoreductase [Sandaracinaceae bacterium]
MSGNQPSWSPAAKARLAKIPFLIRPFVKKRIESEARTRGLSVIEEALIDELKSSEHRG